MDFDSSDVVSPNPRLAELRSPPPRTVGWPAEPASRHEKQYHRAILSALTIIPTVHSISRCSLSTTWRINLGRQENQLRPSMESSSERSSMYTRELRTLMCYCCGIVYVALYQSSNQSSVSQERFSDLESYNSPFRVRKFRLASDDISLGLPYGCYRQSSEGKT